MGILDDIRDSVLTPLSQAVSSLYERIAEYITSRLDGVEDTYRSLTSGLVSRLDTTLSSVSHLYDTLLSKVVTPIDTALSKIDDTASYLRSTVVGSITSGLARVDDTLASTTRSILGRIDSGLDAVATTTTTALERVQQATTEALKSTLATLESGLGTIAERSVSALSALPLFRFFDLLKSVPDVAVDVTRDLPQPSPTPGQAGTSVVETIRVNTLAATGSVIGAPFGFLPILSSYVQGGPGPLAEQAALSVYRPTLIPLASAVDAAIRGQITLDDYYTVAARYGLSDDAATILLRLGNVQIPAADVGTLYLRGLITSEDADTRLARLGYSPTDAAHIKQLWQVMPGVQDLITMAVREVFSPEQAEALGLFQDYPEAFGNYAAQVGLSEEWARRYWAAHWQLPSANMGYEMYQRGIISADDLRSLLRALDYSPVWRDKLIQLAHTPVTRVDIRRLHKVGLYSYDDVVAAYRRIGYTDDDARLLADYTVRANVDEAKQEKAASRDLTRSDVVTAYVEGVLDDTALASYLERLGYDEAERTLIYALARSRRTGRETKEQAAAEAAARKGQRDLTLAQVLDAYRDGLVDSTTAQTMVMRLGYDNNESSILLQQVDYKLAAQALSEETKVTVDRAKAGLITVEQMQDELYRLGVATSRVQLYVQQVQTARRAAEKVPSEATLTAMLQQSIITADDYVAAMRTHGYSLTWASRMLELAVGKRGKGVKG